MQSSHEVFVEKGFFILTVDALKAKAAGKYSNQTILA
jgi:hypothetical protein